MYAHSAVRAGCTLLLSALTFSIASAQQPATPARSALRIPDSTWKTLSSAVGRPDGVVGYTAAQMNWYGGDRYRLRTVDNLFRDVRGITRYSGELARGLVGGAGRSAVAVRVGFGATDIAAGRMLPLPDSTTWGVSWIDSSADESEALRRCLQRGERIADSRGLRRRLPDLSELPKEIQRLIVRIYVGAAEAEPWLRRSFDAPQMAATLARFGSDQDSLLRFVAAPWTEDRLGQMATLAAASLEMPGWVDRNYLAFGSAILLAHLDRALDELRASGLPSRTQISSLELATELGVIRVFGGGRDTIERPGFLIIDLGGNDLYRGRHATSNGAALPISLVVDLGGDDAYDGGQEPLSMGCGFFGLGGLIDLSGNDTYRVRESGLGAAWYGVGLVHDHEGNDRYDVDSLWGAGCAHIGVGALVDAGGNDTYVCAQQSQGMGSTLGAGLLVDAEGNDRYLARDDGNPSELYLGQSVAMSQGCGYGRRADLGDGHSLAGGVGMLVDGSGNDSYHATAWSQGCGYWWGAGFLEDLGGNDTYRNGKYSLGAGAHFAIGAQVDLDGNDAYNLGNEACMNQFQAHARDGSIGISIDGGGDDQYRLHKLCGGSADLASIALFWERDGNDRYDVRYEADTANAGWNNTPPFGSATSYPPSSSFRDDLDAIGIFLDGAGTDEYVNAPNARNAGEWRSRRDARSLGVGRDE